VRAATSPLQPTNSQSPNRPGFKWFPVRSNSDPSSVPQIEKSEAKVDRILILKPCMKQIYESAATTPLDEQNKTFSNAKELGKLRRVKTVDFEDPVSRKSLSLPPLKVWTGSFTPDRADTSDRSNTNGTIAAKTNTRIMSYPGPMKKGMPADTAVTRTDVHVIAITPSWNTDVMPDLSSINPATPTMQIVESKEGCYEVIWDDIPQDHDIRSHQRRSSASEALYTASPEASRGLDRVNTKLKEWSFGTGSPSEPFQSQIVVFPEDDGRDPQYECTVDVERDYTVIAPPNSERTSANHSRYHSRPPSIRRSASDPYMDDEADHTPNGALSEKPRPSALVVPSPEIPSTHPGYLTSASRRVRKPPSLRRLSNMDDADLKFRGHRDSVTLARSRIFNAGGVSPELFMHRDSVSMAKKRMHVRNHAVSSAREIPTPKFTVSNPSPPLNERELEWGLTPPKEAASQVLKNSSSASMLLPQAKGGNRHIQIVE